MSLGIHVDKHILNDVPTVHQIYPTYNHLYNQDSLST